MRMTRAVLALGVGASAVFAPRATAEPLRLQSGQSAVIGNLTAHLVAVHHPFSRDATGLEHYPFTAYTLTWRDASGKEQARSVSPWTSKVQADVFG